MPTYKNVADGRTLPRSKISTATPSLIRSRRPTYSPFPRSKIHSNSFLIPNKKPRKTPNTAFYGVLYCRQRGSNPHKGGLYTYVYVDCVKIHSKTQKRGRHLPTSYREKRMLAENVLLPIRSCCRPCRTHDTHFPNYARKSVHFQEPQTRPPACQPTPMICGRGTPAACRRRQSAPIAMP